MKRCFAALMFLLMAPVVHAEDSSGAHSRLVQSRAVEAMIWGMPAVNFDLMYQAMVRETKGSYNQIVYWSRLPDWKNQTLTPNPDSIYLMPFFNTKDVGPVVIEIPPADEGSINGTIMDGWQTPLEDVGPAGVDKGAGAKYLVLPPDYKERPPEGYVVLPSSTYQGYALLRSILKGGTDADVAQGAAYGRRIKVYPLSQTPNPAPTKFVDAIDVVYDATIPYDVRFFQSLDRFVQTEPWLLRDKAMIDQLRSIGIEKGKAFNPDQVTQALLNSAAAEARGLFEHRYERLFHPFFESGRWALPALPDYMKAAPDGYSAADSYPVDSRGLLFTFAFFTPKHLGEGQFYLMTIKDKDGNNFDGGKTYRLTVPPNAPVRLYWSATAYDRATHALIRDQSRASRSSQNVGLQKNADGSTDVFFGPKSPAGKETNWVPTVAGGEFEVLFRLYGPEKSFFEKKWVLPDIETVTQ
ncbi:DUF1254 domain-containing protein [Bradyrhizobium tropiciagri]|uniref:DUF1254 domain-containing protein n=1 Tax=Bradyrhizobium tropiciagri TaxID=312253 RepID=UPI001BABB456|nr:DUF1254 domain-containing protein [Bradyrhizobium tropiciagri]MBR0874411.1 DUF1254 domain-containing protein [Bradyrhizobium tropiciagri]